MRTLPFLIVLAALVACDRAAAPPPPPAAAAPASAAAPAAAPAAVSAALLNPDSTRLGVAGPDSFVVHFVTSRGPFDLMVYRAWSPRGADRFHYLAANGFYDGVHFFRVLKGFMAQFGVHGDPSVTAAWERQRLLDDPVKHSNTRGMLTFAMTSAPNTRGTQLFINYGNNAQLDASGFSPLGQVTKGISVVDSLYGGYGEGAPGGAGPDQSRIVAEGNKYLNRDFPKLDSIVTARVGEEWKKK